MSGPVLSRIRSRAETSRPDEGAVALIAAIVVFFIVFALLALSIDIGRAYYEKSQMQNAVDAAALAGAQGLCGTDADPAQTAVDYAAKNQIFVAKASVVVDTTNNTITVPATGSVVTFFGGLLGRPTISLSESAKAGKVCGIPKFGLYSDTTLTFNGSNSDAIYVYAGDQFTPNGTGTDIVFLQTDPTGTVDAGANIGTISKAGSGLTAAQYAYIFPVTSTLKLDASADVTFDNTSGVSFVDQKSVPTGAITSCGNNSNATKNALNGAPVGRFVCTAGQVKTSGLTSGFTGYISSTYPIDLAGAGVITFNPKLIYSSATGTAINLSGIVNTDPDTIIYAPNGTAIVSSSGNNFSGTVIAKSIQFNGAKQNSTAEGSIIPGVGGAGGVTLLQ